MIPLPIFTPLFCLSPRGRKRVRRREKPRRTGECWASGPASCHALLAWCASVCYSFAVFGGSVNIDTPALLPLGKSGRTSGKAETQKGKIKGNRRDSSSSVLAWWSLVVVRGVFLKRGVESLEQSGTIRCFWFGRAWFHERGCCGSARDIQFEKNKTMFRVLAMLHRDYWISELVSLKNNRNRL